MLDLKRIVSKEAEKVSPFEYRSLIVEEKTMQKQQVTQPSSGSKAIALDNSKLLRKYRLYQLLILIGGAATTIALHLIFVH